MAGLHRQAPGTICRVAVLDGGFPAWTAEGFPIDTSPVSEEEVDAAASAARGPATSTSYPAKLRVPAQISAEHIRGQKCLKARSEIMHLAKTQLLFGRLAGFGVLPR